MTDTKTVNTPPKTATGSLAGGLLAATRPKQWIKNILVLAAPFVAGKLIHADVLLRSVTAFVAFTLAAAGIYLINDSKDIEADRAHPTKCNRPIASGRVPVQVALIVGAVLLVGSLALAFVLSPTLLVVMAVYVVVQLAYCFGLKHQPVIEMCIVASGFLIRSIAGGVASSLPLSQWFLLVTAFGSLFMVAGKRYAEALLVERTNAQTRKSLKGYSASYLRFVWALSAAVMIVMYSLWAFDLHQTSHSIWTVISIIPFVIAVLRYSVDIDNGSAGAPEEAVMRDRILLLLGLTWVVSLGLAIYLF